MRLHNIGMDIHVYPNARLLFESLKDIRGKFQVRAHDFERKQWFGGFPFGKQHHTETAFTEFSDYFVFAEKQAAGKKRFSFDFFRWPTRQWWRLCRRIWLQCFIIATEKILKKAHYCVCGSSPPTLIIFAIPTPFVHKTSKTAVAVAEKKALTAAEEAELNGLWRKLVKLYHPDRFANEPDKLATYEKLTAAINRAKEAGDIKTLREIAEDPAGFILRQGWTGLDFSDEVELAELRRLG